MGSERTLAAVRADIDAIDDQIHALIMRRTRLVEDVRAIKHDWRIKIQPSREAEILCRLLAQHRGPFPKRELATIWRLLIVATLSFEGPFAVAVYVPAGDSAWWDLARDHFGPFVPLQREASIDAVLDRVAAGAATVGVVPVPSTDGMQPWWLRLAEPGPRTPRIIARLPFIGGSNALTGGREGLAVCPITLTATGRDRTYLIAATAKPSPLARLRGRLETSGLPAVVAMTPWFAAGSGESLALIEFDGFVACDDPRLRLTAFGEPENVWPRLVVVGGYARPLTAAELAPSDADDTSAADDAFDSDTRDEEEAAR